jgi:two-component system chemotaxis sensor kinase CheA
MKAIIDTIVLPAAISDFERKYLDRMNRVGFLFFALHLPAFVMVAYFNETGPWLAAVLTAFALVGPALAYRSFESPRHVSVSYGFTAMLMGGLLVHFGQGPVQIEMHFYFFALLAMLALYGNPMVIVVAAVTVALHHLALWWLLPSSVFNYEAPMWVVLVHAAFVVLESVGTIFIARSFFDNVIGLEKIVQARTVEVERRIRDMRLVLDNVQQGLVSVDLDGRMSSERSRVLDGWLGAAAADERLADYIAKRAPVTADALAAGWEQLADGILPTELSLDQLPKSMVVDERHLKLDYTPIHDGDALSKVLVVISDVTSEVARERLEGEQREVIHIFDHVMVDKVGFVEFVEESARHIEAICNERVSCPTTLKRIVHTLKGNAAIFRMTSLAEQCHRIESRLVEDGQRPSEHVRAELEQRWEVLRRSCSTLLGERAATKLEIDDVEHHAVLAALREGRPRPELARMIAAWKLEPTRRRLARVAGQAQRIADRLNKSDLTIEASDADLRLDPQRWAPFWQAFIHVVRNAVDHGIENADDRLRNGKAGAGTLFLGTRRDGDEFVVEIRDDGRGIDWDAIAGRASQCGLDTSSREALLEALFSDAVSTAASVNEFSGRGIGMGAVRAACRELNGKVLVHSNPGDGTSIQFRFPAYEMAGEAVSAAA